MPVTGALSLVGEGGEMSPHQQASRPPNSLSSRVDVPENWITSNREQPVRVEETSRFLSHETE